jgi:hypothetical protein
MPSGPASDRTKPIRAGTVAIDNHREGVVASARVTWLGFIDSISTTPATSAG